MHLFKWLAALTTAGLTAAASADVKTFTAGSDDKWHTASNWSPSGVPTKATRVIIPTGETCRVTLDAVADTLEVELGGTLSVQDGATLALDNNDDNVPDGAPDDSIIAGTVELRPIPTTPPVPSRLLFLKNHTLYPDRDENHGTVRGFDTVCEIAIAEEMSLINKLGPASGGIMGRLTVRGEGSLAHFYNFGKVEAEGNTLVLASTTELHDMAGARWVIGCKDTMQFDREAMSLEGDFEDIPGPGIFRFNQGVLTCGTYVRHSCSSIDLGPAGKFKYASFDGGSFPCPNPGAGAGGCLSPFEVSTDVTGASCG